MASVIVLCCVFWAGAVDGVGFHEGGKLLNVGGLPTTISLFTFCYCGHAVFPTLCNSMKDRSQFSKHHLRDTHYSELNEYRQLSPENMPFPKRDSQSQLQHWPYPSPDLQIVPECYPSPRQSTL
ncbi:amino acid transporter avt1i [Quercus suber]|uniref:Amino acid transporter avt1i n=1 Tax=Quercus suber TaxID=58331 RepID=A0AAW0KFQ8_QUESU